MDRLSSVTERARRVFSLAQDEARRLNHHYIGTEHLLLGLVGEGDGIAARVLNNLGVQLPRVRVAVEFIIGRGETMIMGEIGLTPRAKKVVELAVDEARRLNHQYIGTEHLLLGLVREGEGIAARVLESLGVRLDQARAQVLRALGQGTPPDVRPLPPPGPPPTLPPARGWTGTAPAALGELRAVVPVAARIARGPATLTLIAIERYDAGALATFHLRLAGRHHLPIAHTAVAADDDGRPYAAEAFADTVWGGLDHVEQRFSLRLTPPLDPAARVLTIALDPAPFAREQAERAGEPPPAPWTFAIPLPDRRPPAA